MRLAKLIKADIKFQWKYGFYFLYAVLSVLYIIVMLSLPASIRENLSTILIFSDPAAMGLFFMGAIILLEKSQHVLCALSVSPVCYSEYMASKIAALGLISSIVALVIAIAAGKDNLLMVLVGTLCSNMIFSLLGIIVASKIASLNQFILWTVPFEILGFMPAIIYIFRTDIKWLSYYLSNICVDMIAGHMISMPKLVILAFVMAGLWRLAYRSTVKMLRSLGGARL